MARRICIESRLADSFASAGRDRSLCLLAALSAPGSALNAATLLLILVLYCRGQESGGGAARQSAPRQNAGELVPPFGRGLGNSEHGVDGALCFDGDFWWDRDARFHFLERFVQVFNRRLLHVGTDQVFGDGDEGLGWIFFLEAMEDAYFCSDEDGLSVRFLCVAAHTASGEAFVGGVADILWAFRMDKDRGVWIFFAGGGDGFGGEACVCGAIAWPKDVGAAFQ